MTWTILQNDDSNHLGLRCNAFPEHQMALITSGCLRNVFDILLCLGLPWMLSTCFVDNVRDSAPPPRLLLLSCVLPPAAAVAVGLWPHTAGG